MSTSSAFTWDLLAILALFLKLFFRLVLKVPGDGAPASLDWLSVSRLAVFADPLGLSSGPTVVGIVWLGLGCSVAFVVSVWSKVDDFPSLWAGGYLHPDTPADSADVQYQADTVWLIF